MLLSLTTSLGKAKLSSNGKASCLVRVGNSSRSFFIYARAPVHKSPRYNLDSAHIASVHLVITSCLTKFTSLASSTLFCTRAPLWQHYCDSLTLQRRLIPGIPIQMHQNPQIAMGSPYNTQNQWKPNDNHCKAAKTNENPREINVLQQKHIKTLAKQI